MLLTLTASPKGIQLFFWVPALTFRHAECCQRWPCLLHMEFSPAGWRVSVITQMNQNAFPLGTKTNNSKNKQKTKSSLNVVICLGSGVTIIPECHSSASPVNGNDTPRRQSSVYTKQCRRCLQEGAGLRQSLQSDATRSSNNFISLAAIAKRHIKKMKGSHLTSNWCFPLSQDSF